MQNLTEKKKCIGEEANKNSAALNSKLYKPKFTSDLVFQSCYSNFGVNFYITFTQVQCKISPPNAHPTPKTHKTEARRSESAT
jgi:hypothetical protein